MNVYEISAQYGIPVGKLKRLAKAGLLLATASDDRAAKMRIYLSSHRPLSVVQLLDLARDDGTLMGQLGSYDRKAQALLAEIGNPALDALPADLAATWIYGAAIADPEILARVVEWLSSIIPAAGCGYHYVGARMLWNCPKPRFAASYKFLGRAILNARNVPALAGWSTKAGKEGMRFHRPPAFDL